MESTLNVFGPVASAESLLLSDEVLDDVNFVSEVGDAEALRTFTKIAIAYKTYSHGESLVFSPHIIDDLSQSVLGPFNPLLHRPCAVHDEAQIKHVLAQRASTCVDHRNFFRF